MPSLQVWTYDSISSSVPVNALSHPKKYGFIISNPPYGERIEEKKNLPALYTEIGERFAALDACPCI